MRIEVRLKIEAPPAVVYRFYTHLDHLRFICTTTRREWSPRPGIVLREREHAEVRIQQGQYSVTLRFETVRLSPDRLIEDHFSTWPVKGARHVVRLAPEDLGGATALENEITWEAPWYLRRMIDRHGAEQRAFFTERHQNAKRLIEAVYRLRGADAFLGGIPEDAAAVGVAPVVP